MAQPQTIPDPDLITKMECFTKKYYRDTYPSIDPTQPELSQAGKVVIVTGASRGIGKQVRCIHMPLSDYLGRFN